MLYSQKTEKIESIKFYYYGVVVNGETFKYQCFHEPTEEGITIENYNYGYLPSSIFKPYVERNQHWFTVPQDHPFYKFVLLNYKKDRIRRWKAENKRLAKRITKLEKYGQKYDDSIKKSKDEIMQNSNLIDEYTKVCAAEKHSQPTKEDIETFYQWREKVVADYKEEQRLKREAEEEALKKEFEEEKKITTYFLDSAMEKYPLNKEDGKPYVQIHWSECPAFYRWKDDELEISLAAAEEALFKIDNYYFNKERGYNKTKFVIHDKETTYEGRYDLGDGEEGLINHIRKHGKWLIEFKDHFCGDEEKGKEIIAFAEYLQSFIMA